VGTPKEPTRHELRQAEPLHTPILQEEHHPQARRVPETGVPVRSQSVRRRRSEEEEEEEEEMVMTTCQTKKPHCLAVHLNPDAADEKVTVNLCTDQPPMVHTSTASTEATAAAWRPIRAERNGTKPCGRWDHTLKKKQKLKKKKVIYSFHNVILKWSSLQSSGKRPRGRGLCLFVSLTLTGVSVWVGARCSGLRRLGTS